MLSPVMPPSAVDHSFTAATPRPENVPAAAAVMPAPADVPDAPNLASGTGIRAVSGELQLSKNVSVLAETLGKLLNIARKDGEAAEAYVNRLVDSIKTLPPDQRASLEKGLGDILRSISLDALVSALKNSSGPEAARLAVLFEMTRSGPAAPETKPSVPTYLQDLLPDSLDDAPIRTPASSSAGKAGEQASVNPPPRADVAVSPEAVKQAIAAPQSDVDGAAPPAKPAEAGAVANPSAKIMTGVAVAPSNEQRAATRLLQQSPQATGKPVQMAGTPQQQAAPPPATAIPASPVTGDKAAVSQTVAKPVVAVAPMVDTEEAAASARIPTAQAAPIDNIRAAASLIADAFATATPKQMERLLLSVLLGKLPVSAETLTTQTPSVPLTLPVPEEALAAKTPPPHGAIPQANAEQATESALAPSQRPELLAAQRASVAHDIKAILLEQPTLQAAVAAMIGKEATGLPYVAYPMAKDETESDSPPRGRWPSSQGDGEETEGGGEQPDDGDREERMAANDEPFDHSVSEGANDDANIGDAESYYLRMSGFS